MINIMSGNTLKHFHNNYCNQLNPCLFQNEFLKPMYTFERVGSFMPHKVMRYDYVIYWTLFLNNFYIYIHCTDKHISHMAQK